MKAYSVALVVTALGLVTAVEWTAGGRSVLKPGWNMFTPHQDVEVGRLVSSDVGGQLRMLDDSVVGDYVNALGRRLAATAPGETYPYHVRVVDDAAINAFALPGGLVFINRGVVEAAENESQLAGVIAHEIAHVALRHGTSQASRVAAFRRPLALLGGLLRRDSARAKLALSGAGVALDSVLLKYSRSAEREADLLATQILYDAGYDPRAMGRFFQTLEADQQAGGHVEFFSNHPDPGNRIERVAREAAALGGVWRGAGTTSGAFDQNRRRTISRPAPRDELPQAGGNTRTARTARARPALPGPACDWLSGTEWCG